MVLFSIFCIRQGSHSLAVSTALFEEILEYFRLFRILDPGSELDNALFNALGELCNLLILELDDTLVQN